VRERHRGGEGNVLGSDDQGPAGQSLVPQVHPLLQLTGGHHPGGAVAGDQPGRPRPFPAPGGQQHGRRAHRLDPAAAGQRDRVRRVEAGHGGAQPELGPRSHRRGGQRPCVRRAGHHPVPVAQAEPGVGAVPGDTAGLGLPVGHEHRTDAEAPQLDGRRQPGRPGADYHDGHAGTSAASSRDTAAAQ
jgi:hypothetical protein